MPASKELSEGPRTRSRIAIWELMLVIAGLSLGIWIFRTIQPKGAPIDLEYLVFLSILGIGGIAAVGPILLLIDSRRRRTRWGGGRILWFAEGSAAWLLWPPFIYNQWNAAPGQGGRSESLCYYYGTPFMAIYMMAALLAGGHGPRRRKRRLWQTLDWKERFGWILSGLWACTGLYLLARLYWTEFRR